MKKVGFLILFSLVLTACGTIGDIVEPMIKKDLQPLPPRKPQPLL